MAEQEAREEGGGGGLAVRRRDKQRKKADKVALTLEAQRDFNTCSFII